MATVMAVGRIQQSTKKGTTETAMPLLLAAAVVVAVVTAAWWQHCNGGSGSEALAARAAWQWQQQQRQCHGSSGSGSLAVAAAAWLRRRQLGCNGGSLVAAEVWWCMDFSAEGGGSWRTEVGIKYTQENGKKCSEKRSEIFVMQKCSDGDEHFSEHFFQSWNEIANTQKIVGWYKVCI